MFTCDDCRDLIWDYIYDLLEAVEAETLRAHLRVCGFCQAELIRAEEDQQLLARTFRLNREVPRFVAPEPTRVLRLPFRRRTPRRPKPVLRWLAAAAVLLVFTGLPFGLYYRSLSAHQAELARTETEVQRIAAERLQVQEQAEREAAVRTREALARNVHYELLGPAGYQPGSVSSYRVLATALSGDPAEVRVAARLVDAQNQVVQSGKVIAGKGIVQVALPTDWDIAKTGPARLELVARGPEDREQILGRFPVSPTAYLANLTLDKPGYRPGERLRFRSLILERSTLKPPRLPFLVTCTLLGPGGFNRSIRGMTRPDGILGGEFLLPDNAPEGRYTLTVTESEKHFQAPTASLQVFSRSTAPQHEPPPSEHPALAAQDIVDIEFFPEGGNLIAGVPNRVYFRARTSDGKPVDFEGQIMDGHGHEVCSVRTALETAAASLAGLGEFHFTPQAGETYRLKITAPASIKSSTTLPIARHNGLAMHVGAGVIRGEESIRLTISGASSERSVAVGVACRGQLMAYQTITLQRGTNEITLTPPSECHGVLRVTLFDAQGERLRPLAERLIYRAPARRLDLFVRANKEHFRPGEHVTLQLHSQNEKGIAEQSWLLVSVVDQAAVSGATRSSLPTSFHLLTQVEHPEELENADFLISDDPKAATVLDLVLGTQGWRRFVEHPADTALASLAPDMALLVKLDNLDKAKRQYDEEITRTLTGVRLAAEQRDRNLAEHESERIAEARAATTAIEDLQARVTKWVRWGGRLIAALMLATACVLLGSTGLKALRGLKRPRRGLAWGSSSLAAGALAIVLAGHHFGEPPNVATLDEIAQGLSKPTLESFAQTGKIFQADALAKAGEPGRELAAADRSFHLAARPQTEREPLAPVPGGGPASSNRPAMPIMTIRAGEGAGPHSPASSPLPVREYAYRHPSGGGLARHELPETLLWSPALRVHGTALTGFDLPEKPGAYRVRVEGNSELGRLGTIERVLEVPPSK
jgi:hypothetical protein